LGQPFIYKINAMSDKIKSRRDFLQLNFSKSNGDQSNVIPSQKVKMLTSDGKIVEIDRELLNKVSKNNRATNKEIFDWMKNPSKEDNK